MDSREITKKENMSRKTLFFNTLRKTNKDIERLIGWEKINKTQDRFENVATEFDNLLNTKKDKIDGEIISLFKEKPELIRILPHLAAVKEDKNYFTEFENDDFGKETELDFKNIPEKMTDEKAEIFLDFMKKTNLVDLFVNQRISSFSDYLLGVEVGRNTNSRKNNNGNQYKKWVENYIKDIIKDEKDYEIKVDTYIVVNTPNGKINIKTNFYNEKGSKLESQVNKYINESKKEQFVWVTDGLGWENDENKTLFSTIIKANPNIFNTEMVKRGLLKKVIFNEK